MDKINLKKLNKIFPHSIKLINGPILHIFYNYMDMHNVWMERQTEPYYEGAFIKQTKQMQSNPMRENRK